MYSAVVCAHYPAYRCDSPILARICCGSLCTLSLVCRCSSVVVLCLSLASCVVLGGFLGFVLCWWSLASAGVRYSWMSSFPAPSFGGYLGYSLVPDGLQLAVQRGSDQHYEMT